MAHSLTQPDDLVAWMGVVQAQDYPAAKWGIGLRLPDNQATDIEEAISKRKIVRTWALRGTLHILTAADIRWVLALVCRTVIARHTLYDRRYGLDDTTFEQSHALLANVLQGGKQLTRKELAAIFEQNKISTKGLRFTFLLYRAALEGVICFGPMRGKQQTFTLLDEWVPPFPVKDREDALAELSRRFFASHGPATIKDFAWWSGLTASDSREAVELIKGKLVTEKDGDLTYWRSLDQEQPEANESIPNVQLVPDFDEYLVGYTDRLALFHPRIDRKVDLSFGLLGPTILIDGRIAGTWKRTFEKKTVVINCQPYYPLNSSEREYVEAAANRFASFLRLPGVVKIEA